MAINLTSYKIAIASSDGVQIDESFGPAARFIIYEVSDETYKKVEERDVVQEALRKIVFYFNRVDHHQSLQG